MSSDTPNSKGASNADAHPADAVQIHTCREHIRRRPGMFVGDCGVRGLHHLVYELVDNSLNEVVAGRCRLIDVELLACGGCRVTDEGRGLPTETMKGGTRAFEVLLTHVCVGPKSDPVAYHSICETRGFGLLVVNALSTNLVAEVRRDYCFWRQWFQRGAAYHPPHAVRISSGRTGTRISFWPDRAIFREDRRFQFDLLCGRLRQLAALNAGVTIRLTDRRGEDPQTESFHFASGLDGYHRHLMEGRSPVPGQVIHFRGEGNGCRFEIAMQWVNSPGEVIHSFVNGSQTEGGSHVEGLRNAVVAALRERVVKALPGRVFTYRQLASDCWNGLVAAVAVTTSEPHYEGTTKQRINNPEIQAAIREVASGLLSAFLDRRPEDAAAIVGRIAAARSARCS